MTALQKKLYRGLWKIRGQVLAVALVIASGVATLVMALSTVDALSDTTAAYYQRYRFADVFANAVRVPERLSQTIATIPGVQSVQTRISAYATVSVEGFNEPVMAQMVSIPDDGQPVLNQLVIRQGQWPSAHHSDEVIINEPFAEAHNLSPGDRLDVTMKGKKKTLRVVAIGLSPEFIYALGPGALLPDDKRFGVFWMARSALAASYDLKDAFNQVVLSLSLGANPQPVLDALDSLLEKYGGTSAIERADQLSNWFLMNEIAQQKTMGKILPTIFIVIAVFLTNMVLARLIATERTEIGLLKAFGYSRLEIGWHFLQMMIVIASLGVLIGCGVGMWFGRMNTQLYAEMFRFPLLIYQPGAQAFVLSLLVSVLAVCGGAGIALRKAMSLSPAQAMIPPSPPVYRKSVFSGNAMNRALDQTTRIAVRQIERWPARSLMTSMGIGFAVALVVLSFQWNDSIGHITRVYFHEAQRQDVTIGLAESVEKGARYDFAHLPGVTVAEPMRFISVEMRANNATHRGALTAIEQQSRLYPIFDDKQRRAVSVPDSGVVLASRLAKKLGVTTGDTIEIEVLQGKRQTLPLSVANTIEAYIGMPAYVNLDAINRLLVESPRFEYVNLSVDEADQYALFNALKDTPAVSSIMVKQAALDMFNQTVVEHVMVFISMFSILAAILGFGVAYNSTRIALSERARELATLRVLGFTKGEISYVLLGEVMLLICLGLVMGCGFGYLLAWVMAQSFDTELFRIPLMIDSSTYGWAVIVIFIATVVSAALVSRRINKLDLIRVLKTRE